MSLSVSCLALAALLPQEEPAGARISIAAATIPYFSRGLRLPSRVAGLNPLCNRSRSSRSSAADGYRNARSFSRSSPMIRSSSAGTFGFRSRTGWGVLFRRASKMIGEVGPSNGRDPVTISYRTTPNDHRSLRASTSLAARLFGRHVGDGAHGRARLGEHVHGHAFGIRGLVVLGQAEVEHLGVTAFGYKNVGRLDIAMDDPLGMGGVQRVGDLNAQRHARPGYREASRRCARAASCRRAAPSPETDGPPPRRRRKRRRYWDD